MTQVTWILEPRVFPETHDAMCEAIRHTGQGLKLWDDDWIIYHCPEDNPVLFHGSLNTALYVLQEAPWKPGAYCNAPAFECSTWYPNAARWLLHQRWSLTTAKELVNNPDQVLSRVGATDAVFVRPNSALKPFSGRVLQRQAISLAALDYGYYFEDEDLPVVIMPVRPVTREWRYVVVNQNVVAGSAYHALGRKPTQDDPHGAPWKFAESIAQEMPAPENVYVLDVCEANNDLHLLEVNPFSGADLYACSRRDTVQAVSTHILQETQS